MCRLSWLLSSLLWIYFSALVVKIVFICCLATNPVVCEFNIELKAENISCSREEIFSENKKRTIPYRTG